MTRRTIKSVVVLMMTSQRKKGQPPVWGYERKGLVLSAKWTSPAETIGSLLSIPSLPERTIGWGVASEG